MTRKRCVIIGLVGGVVLVLVVCVFVFLLPGRDGQGLEKSAEATVIRPVPTAVVQASPGDCTRMFPGKVRANRRVELAFSVPGLLEQLNAGEGRSIRKGEILARLDQRDYRYALDAASARCANAARELARFNNLRRQKVVTDVECEDTETAHDIAVAELHIREKAFEDTVLHAPFGGIVVRRYVENHEHVQAGQAIVSFQDISLIEVVIQMPERLLAHGGTDALKALQVCFDADSERWFNAAIREYSAESDSVTQTYDVVVALTPPPDLKVFPGMTATVKARIANSPGTPQPDGYTTRIPVEALCSGVDGKSYVWVIDPAGGKPRRRQVEAADLYGDYVVIRSGLQIGEHVAVAGLHTLRESLLVRPMIAGREGLDG